MPWRGPVRLAEPAPQQHSEHGSCDEHGYRRSEIRAGDAETPDDERDPGDEPPARLEDDAQPDGAIRPGRLQQTALERQQQPQASGDGHRRCRPLLFDAEHRGQLVARQHASHRRGGNRGGQQARPALQSCRQRAPVAKAAERAFPGRRHLECSARNQQDHAEVEKCGERSVARRSEQPREHDGGDYREQVRGHGRCGEPGDGDGRRPTQSPQPSSVGRRRRQGRQRHSGNLVHGVAGPRRAINTLGAVTARHALALAAAALALASPPAASAQTPGDDQYTDPFGGSTPSQPERSDGGEGGSEQDAPEPSTGGGGSSGGGETVQPAPSAPPAAAPPAPATTTTTTAAEQQLEDPFAPEPGQTDEGGNDTGSSGGGDTGSSGGGSSAAAVVGRRRSGPARADRAARGRSDGAAATTTAAESAAAAHRRRHRPARARRGGAAGGRRRAARDAARARAAPPVSPAQRARAAPPVTRRPRLSAWYEGRSLPLVSMNAESQRLPFFFAHS